MTERHFDMFGWFPDESEKTLLDLIKKYDVKTVIEIGAFLGKSTSFFAKHCEHVHTIDPFQITGEALDNYREILNLIDETGSFREQFSFNMIELGFDNITVHASTSEDAANRYAELSADLVYIDGSHAYDDVVKDIQLFLPRTKKIICGDDYDRTWTGVRDAVRNCFNEYSVAGRVLYKELT